MAAEPGPPLMLNGAALDEALAAIGDFADLVSPYLVGHSSGVADLASAAGERLGLDVGEVLGVRRSALLHDLGRVAVPPAIWQKAGPLTRGRLGAGETARLPHRAGAEPLRLTWRRSRSPRPRTTSGSTARATTAAVARRRCRPQRGCSRLPTPTTR